MQIQRGQYPVSMKSRALHKSPGASHWFRLFLGAVWRSGLLSKAWFVMEGDVIHTMLGRETKHASREGSELFQFCTQWRRDLLSEFSFISSLFNNFHFFFLLGLYQPLTDEIFPDIPLHRIGRSWKRVPNFIKLVAFSLWVLAAPCFFHFPLQLLQYSALSQL